MNRSPLVDNAYTFIVDMGLSNTFLAILLYCTYLVYFVSLYIIHIV